MIPGAQGKSLVAGYMPMEGQWEPGIQSLPLIPLLGFLVVRLVAKGQWWDGGHRLETEEPFSLYKLTVSSILLQ